MSRSTLSFLAFASLCAPLLACDDPEPAPTSVTIAPLECGRLECSAATKVVAGGKIAFDAEPAGLAASARMSDPSIATVADGYLQNPDAWTVTALQPGKVTLELLDDEQHVIGTREVEIAAADHLEATIKIIQGESTTQLDRVIAEQPREVPSRSKILISVDPRAGEEPLLGWLDYEVTTALSGGAVMDHYDVGGNAVLRLGSGEQAITFKAGALSGRFMLSAR